MKSSIGRILARTLLHSAAVSFLLLPNSALISHAQSGSDYPDGGQQPTQTQTGSAGGGWANPSSADPSQYQVPDSSASNPPASAAFSSNGQSASDDGTSMSADQIVEIMRQHPDVMSDVKNVLAQKLGVDPSTITDQQIFDRIHQDTGLREQVSSELVKRGYTVNPRDPNAQEQVTATEPSISPMQSSTRPPLNPGSVGSNPGIRRDGLQGNVFGPPARRDGLQPNPEEQEPDFRLRQRIIPYRNLPSLRDLYSQVSPDTFKLRRFGSNTFRFSGGNAAEVPMDLPAGPDYVLGPGDALIVNLWGTQSSRLNRVIDRQGQIALPEAGTVAVSGLTIAQAQAAMQVALSSQYQNEHVEISLGKVRTVRVYVVGDVQRPGAYDLSSLSTPLNALYAAGGPTSRGSLRTLRQLRGQQLVAEIDLYDFLLRGVKTSIERLMPGDTILVPPVGPQVTVGGMVKRPAIYELRGTQDLKSVLDMAGGLLASASLKQVRVERVEAHEKHTMLSAELSADTTEAVSKLAPLAIQDGDEVFVSPILPYNEQVVYLDGHVFRPGRYPWREGMTVNDLVHSYQDVMPEPANHAEIIRLQPPDLHPETISLDLSEVLVGNDPIVLKPFDVVRLFSRYEIDPPRVSIYGEVLRPGDYPMSEGMTAAGLVRMAGGFRRSAYQQEADLSSYEIQNGEKVLVNHSVIAIDKALAGDKGADVALRSGDVVGIRQLTGWKDIGASITVEGEVKYAGTYGINEGERLSDLLKRVGGFREDAYPAGAVFERVQVRQIEETSRQEMIRRIESSAPTLKPGISSAQDQTSLLQAMQQQQEHVLSTLRNRTSSGRLVIKISPDVSKWENTAADITLRAGDRLIIPKRPDFVTVNGEVYNATGITYRPGKDAEWYLRQAGGVTRSGDKRAIFIVRADGSVAGRGGGIFEPSVLGLHLRPGDSIVVPEKVLGGSMLWRNLIGTAQVMASVAVTGAAAGIF